MRPTWLRYAMLTLVAWGTVPEIRRLIDFKMGLFQPVEIASVIPLAMLVPYSWYAFRGGWRNAHSITRGFATIWLAANGYALIIGLLTGAPPAAAAYEFVNYCLATGLGIWFANELRRNDGAYRTIVYTLLAVGSFSSAYAVVQYISPPPWDAMWIYASGFKGAGMPYPFSLRAWGTMSSPGPFADYLIMTVLLALPLVGLRKPLALSGIVLCCVGLAVTFVRADTLVLGACLAVYLVCSPRRGATALAIGSLFVIVAIGFAIAPSFGETGTRLQDRLSDRYDTIGKLDTDVSVLERQNQIENGIDAGNANPIGVGLGVLGVAAKLDGVKGEALTLDSGYVSRFEALGYLGMAGYLIVTLGALGRSLVLIGTCASQDERERAVVIAAAATAQAALVAIDVAVDGHSGFDGIFFWLAIAIAFGYRNRVAVT